MISKLKLGRRADARVAGWGGWSFVDSAPTPHPGFTALGLSKAKSIVFNVVASDLMISEYLISSLFNCKYSTSVQQ